jgi:hypothetical protein
VATGSTVQLNGTGSTDPAGLSLNYEWSFVSKPSGSTAKLSSVSSAKPTFVADEAGTYKVQLTVCDGGAAARRTRRSYRPQPICRCYRTRQPK